MRKIIPVIVAGTTALALAGGLGYATLDKKVTVSVDGAAKDINTFSGTVGDVLEDQGVKVSERDVVAPALDEKVTDGTRIAVQFSREVKVEVDGKPQTFWTTATSVDQALKALDIDSEGAKLSTSRGTTIGRQGLELAVTTQKDVTVNIAGKKKSVQTTGKTVADAVKAAGVKPDSNDILSPKSTTALKDGTTVTFTKVDVRKKSKTKDIDFETTWKDTDELKKGETKVETEGKVGEETTTYTEVLHNGKVKSKKKGTTKVTTEPTNKVVLVGTKEEPKPEPEQNDNDSDNNNSDDNDAHNNNSNNNDDSNNDDSNNDDNAPSVASGSVWDKLAQCESGGDWSINTGNGFYGGLQFTLQTWRGFGGSGMPHHASREEQIRIAKKVQAQQGWGAWPSCTSQLGIR